MELKINLNKRKGRLKLKCEGEWTCYRIDFSMPTSICQQDKKNCDYFFTIWATRCDSLASKMSLKMAALSRYITRSQNDWINFSFLNSIQSNPVRSSYLCYKQKTSHFPLTYYTTVMTLDDWFNVPARCYKGKMLLMSSRCL